MIDLLDILRIEETDISVEIFLTQLLSFQQQGISGLQDSLPGTHFQTLALTGNGHQHHIVLFFEARIRHALAYQVAVKCQVAGLQLPLAFHLGHTIDVMSGIHQLVRLAQVQDGINLAGIDQTVATKYELIGGNGRDNLFVETYDFDQAASPHIHQATLADTLPHQRVRGRHHQLHCIIGNGLKRTFR